jgi:micrococcal nuclease
LRCSRRLVAAAVAAVVVGGSSGCSWPGSTPATRANAIRADGANGIVARVVDGDTIRVSLLGGGASESVRLIGVDTPETKDRRPVQCFGREAAAFTARVLPPATRVRLVRDVEARDRYGRLLAYVYRARDGLFVNRALVERGYARPLTIPPNVAHVDAFVAAAAAARADQRGLWRRCAVEEARGPPDLP